MRFVSVLLLGLALSACSLGATSTEVPVPTLEPSSSSMASAGESMSASDSMESPSAMSCQEAFDALDTSGIDSVSDLNSLSAELDSTISACPTVDEWVTMVQSTLPVLDTTDAQAWLQARCDENTTIAASAVCDEISGM